MSRSLCVGCHLSLTRSLLRQSLHYQRIIDRGLKDCAPANGNAQPKLHKPEYPKSDIYSILSTPSWSLSSLLPPSAPSIAPDSPHEKLSSSTPVSEREITPMQLHHLLRLSALPLPSSQAEEERMLDTLHHQLYFLKKIHEVDTEGVEPLVALRDETEEGVEERTVRLEHLKEVLDQELKVGRARRRRRVRDSMIESEKEMKEGWDKWDVLGTAEEVAEVAGSGRYFVVRSGKGQTKQ